MVVSNIKPFLNMNMRTLLVEYEKKYYKICKSFMQKFFKPLSKCFLILTGSQICLGYQKLLFCKIIFSSSFFGKDSFSNNFISFFLFLISYIVFIVLLISLLFFAILKRPFCASNVTLSWFHVILNVFPITLLRTKLSIYLGSMISSSPYLYSFIKFLRFPIILFCFLFPCNLIRILKKIQI